MIKPSLFECSAWHNMFVLSEGFIHETRSTSLLVCHEGVSLFVWLQWHVNLWQRQSAVKLRLEMAHIFFSESPLITLRNFSWRNPVYTLRIYITLSYCGAFYWHWQTKARNRNLCTVICVTVLELQLIEDRLEDGSVYL